MAKPSPGLQLDSEQLKLTSDEQRHLQDLARAWETGPAPVVFVGAGMASFNVVPRSTSSPPSRLRPATWVELADVIRSRLAKTDDQRARLPTDPLRLAELFVTDSGSRSQLLDLIEDSLSVEQFDPGPAYHKLVTLPWAAVVTTNYDDFLERAFHETSSSPFWKVVADVDLPRQRSRLAIPLIKMHGDLQRRESIIISETDYQSYESTRPGVALKVRQLLLEHPILFVGFGLTDPNVSVLLRWVETVAAEARRPCVAIVHSDQLESERRLWNRRCVHLVTCRAGVTLHDLLTALHRARRTVALPQLPATPPPDTSHLAADIRDRPPGWATRVADGLTALCSRTPTPECDRRIHDLVVRCWNDSRGPDDVITALGTQCLQRLMRRYAAHARYLHVRPGPPIDVAAGLFAFGELTSAEGREIAHDWWEVTAARTTRPSRVDGGRGPAVRRVAARRRSAAGAPGRPDPDALASSPSAAA